MRFQVIGTNLFRYFSLSLAVIVLLFSSFGAQATEYFWNSPNGGSGNWNTTDLAWYVDSAGTPPAIAWNNGTVGGDDATFNAYPTGALTRIPYTLTLGTGGISVHNITNNYCTLATDTTFWNAYTITGDTLTLVGDSPTINNAALTAGNGMRINSIIAGNSGLVKDGMGYLDLFGNNIYTGATILKAGTVDPQTDTAFGTSSVEVRSGATVWSWGDNGIRTLANAFTLNGSGDGSGAIQANRSGTQSAANTRVTINGPVTIGSATMISAQYSITGTTHGGVASFTFNNTIDGSVANADFTVNLCGQAGSQVNFFNGNINLGSGQLIKDNGGIMQLTGTANNWGALTINEGVVQIGDGGVNNGSLSSTGNINFDFRTYTGDNWNGQLVINRTSDITISNTLYGQSSATYNTNSNRGGLLLASTNTGTVTLTGDNSTFFAPYTVNGGVLKFVSTNSVGAAALIDIAGGASTAMVKFDSGITPMTAATSLSLGGRAAATTPHLENVSGNNTLTGSADTTNPLYGVAVSLYEGGNLGIVQSDAGVGNFLTISGSIQNNAGATFTSPRNVVLQGTGDGEVSGVIGGGTNPAALNVVKSGAGTWTLSGINTYTGSTTVNVGTLKLANDGSTKFGSIASSPQIIVKSGAVFDVSSAYGGSAAWGTTGQTLGGLGNINGIVTDTASGAVTVAPGINDGVTNTTGTLTFNNNLLLNNGAGNKLNFDLGQTPGTYDFLDVLGNLNVTNAAKVAVNFSLLNPTINTGKYPLIHYGSINPVSFLADLNLQGSGNYFTTIGRQTFTLLSSPTGYANQIVLDVTGTAMNLTWVGGVSGNAWNVSTPNWTPGDGFYYEGDLVNFTDAGGLNSPVNLTAKLSPGSMTFGNNAKDYKFIGTGYLSGGTGLTINGTGKVTLANSTANDFTGAIAINSGTLQIGDGVNSGAIPNTDNILDNGTLIFDRPDAFAYTGIISGTGGFVQQGSNTVTLSATNTYTGPTSILGGTLSVSVMANGGTNSNIGASSNLASNLVINGGTLAYIGAAVGTDRLFTLGTGASAGTIDSSGAGRINFTNAGAMAFTGSGARTLTLTGSNIIAGATSGNIIAAVIGNGTGGATSIVKSGAGQWALTGANTYTGSTIINSGLLFASNANALGAATNTTTVNTGGTLGLWVNADGYSTFTQANIVLNGGTILGDDGNNTLASPITLNSDSSIQAQWNNKEVILAGPVTGSGGLLVNGALPAPRSGNAAGTVVLTSNANNWLGNTTITSGNLQIGMGNAANIPDNAGTTITVTGQLATNATNTITIANATITGAGPISQWGSGTLILAGNNPSYNGALWTGGSVPERDISATVLPALNNGALRIAATSAVSGITAVNISGGNSLARIELAGNSATPAAASFAFAGRNPMPSVAAGIVNVSDNNTIAGMVNLNTGGDQYVIESKAGTLTFSNANAIINNSGSTNTSTRYLYLQGASDGVVNGVVGYVAGGSTAPVNVIKSGGGIWTLNGVNNYPGNTTINGGTLALGSLAAVPATISASPLITVNTGATLDVTGTGVGITLAATQTLGGSGTVNGNVADVAGSTFAPGNAYNVGTLTHNGNLTLAGGDNIDYNVNGALADKLTVAGIMTFNTAVTNINFFPTGPVTAGIYTVANSPNALVGAVGNLNLVNTTRYTVNTLTVNPNTITLNVSGSNAQLFWNSATTADNWATSAVWQNGVNPTDSFFPADDVTFDNTSTAATPQVNLTTTVLPMSVTVNGTKNYLITGAGKISGSTGLTQNSSGTTTLATTNDYWGTTKVTAGTLLVSGSIGPNSPVLITGGTLKLGNALALGDNSLTVTAPTTIDGGTITSPGGTLDINGVSNASTRNEPIFVKGVGVGGNGAIINTGASAQAFNYVTMQGDTTIGGTSAGTTDSGRFEIGRFTGGIGGPGFLAGNGYTLTKKGSNIVYLINLGYTNLGAVVVNQGELCIQYDNPVVGTVLGNSSGFLAPITVNAGGQFGMWSPGTTYAATEGLIPTLNNNVTLNGGGIGGTQADTYGPQYYAGTITLNGGGLIYNANVGGTRQVVFSGKITGTGDLTKPSSLSIRGATAAANNDGGSIYFSGSVSNDYTGATYIYGGNASNSFIRLQKSGGAIAIPHNLYIQPSSGGTDVILDAPEQIADTGIVTFAGATGNIPWLDLNGYNETVGGIRDTSAFGVAELFYSGSANSSIFTLNTTTDCSFNGSVRDKTVAGLAGTLSLVKNGGAKQSLLGAQNSYTGTTTINGGTLEVDTLAPGLANSGIGASSSAASNLILNGGSLRYIGTAVSASTDRLFTLGTGASAGTLDASGTDTISWTNTGAVVFTGSGARTLTLSGSNTGNNAIAEIIGNGTGGATSLTKSGVGKWILSSALNSYTGATTINDGVLELSSTGQIATASAISTAAVSAIFQVNGGTHTVGTISGVGTTNLLAGSNLTATSVNQGTVTLGIGSRLTIAPIPGGPTAGAGSLSAVPEPSTWAMLMLAVMGLGMYWRRSR
jgi:fibronectin-binding autotransporter adhesin